MPKYPIYIISKGRFENCLTAKFLIEDGVPFRLVVEPQESIEYIKRFGMENVYILPFSNLGLGSIPARNWCWEDAKSKGFDRHWILDDNIRQVFYRYKAKRIRCKSEVAFRSIEEFTDRYSNIAITGMNYACFLPDRYKRPPFKLNVHVYSCLLIDNNLPHRWRGRYNEDTDLCLQVLSAGLCTVLFNVFTVDKMATLTMKGGNMTELYKADGRLKMARSLERLWPHIVKVGRRFKRPQHIIKYAWARFDTQLKLKPGIDLKDIANIKYNLTYKELKPIKSESLKRFLNSEE